MADPSLARVTRRHVRDRHERGSNIALVGLIALVLCLTLTRLATRRPARTDDLARGVRVGDAASFESLGPDALLLLGAILIVVMAARPQGLLGKPRVEVV